MNIILYMLTLVCLSIYSNGMVCVWCGYCSVSDFRHLLNSAVECAVDDGDDVINPKDSPTEAQASSVIFLDQ